MKVSLSLSIYLSIFSLSLFFFLTLSFSLSLFFLSLFFFLSLSFFSLSIFFLSLSLFFSLSLFSLSLFLFSFRSDCIELDFKEISYLVTLTVSCSWVPMMCEWMCICHFSGRIHLLIKILWGTVPTEQCNVRNEETSRQKIGI